MTSRCGWLLLGIAVGMYCLPGCFPLRARFDGGDGIGLIAVAPPDVAIGKNPPAQEPAIAKAGTSAYPSALEPSVDEAPLARPPSPKLLPPPVAVIPEHGELVVHTLPDPPAASAAKQPAAEPPIKLAPFVQALQCILDDRHQDALKHLQAYDAETQEFYLRILPTFTMLARKRIDQLSAPEVAVLNAQLQSLLTTLRPRTELVIDRMCYCEWFKAYGIYQPVPDTHAFRHDEMVSIYVELRNVASLKRGNCFETRLSSTIEIRDARGRHIKLLDFKDGGKPRRSLSRLNDYCDTYTFLVPPLPAGTYQLVLRIADETDPAARRVAHKILDFRVSPVGNRAN